MTKLVAGLCVGWLLLFVAGAPARDSKDDVPALLKSLKNKDAKTRASAADELGHIGSIRAADAKEAVPVLLEVLKKDKNANVRKSAATAIGKMDPDPKEAVPALTEALKDKVTTVRVAAAGALQMMGPDAKDALEALKDAQQDKDRAVSRAAGMAIRAIQAKKK
jgi:HEAT repeat protein